MRFVLCVVLAGCSLITKQKPLDIQYFTPAPPVPVAATQTSDLRLRVARVSASSHLRYRIALRESPVELSLYTTRRWSERPDAYVRRALDRALFVTRGVGEAVGGAAPALEVEVLAFEEVAGAQRRGRVELRYRLRDDRDVLASGVVTAERPVADPQFDAVVVAIAGALDDATARVADAVVDHLDRR